MVLPRAQLLFLVPAAAVEAGKLASAHTELRLPAMKDHVAVILADPRQFGQSGLRLLIARLARS